MAIDILIPEMGESVNEAILVEWLKADGAAVSRDEAIAVLETDKADAELPAPESGVLSHATREGDTVAVGSSIGTIDTDASSAESVPASAIDTGGSTPVAGSAPSSSANEPDPGDADARSAPASPAVRRMLTELGLTANQVRGSGRGGRLTADDVRRAADTAERSGESELRLPDTAPPTAESVSQERAQTASSPPQATSPHAAGFDGSERREPMTRLRKRIAERLVSVRQNTAMLTTFNEIDMSAIMALRGAHKEAFVEKYGVSLGLSAFFCRGCILALREIPGVNASIEGDEIVYHNYVNLGIAVSTDRGLVVPVIRNAERLSFAGIEQAVKRIASQARDGTLDMSSLSGGTFTITNGGIFGSMMSTPILNPPQSAILGMHAIQKRPVARGDDVVVRPMMYVALSYDHRIVDGRESVTFLVRLKELLEDPTRLMLEI